MQYWKHGSGHIGRIGFGRFGFCSKHHTEALALAGLTLHTLALGGLTLTVLALALLALASLAGLAGLFFKQDCICKPKLLYIVPILILTNTVEFNWKQ